MVPIHRLPDPISYVALGHLGSERQHSRELSFLQATEITENPVLGAAPRRSSYSDPAADEVRAATVLHDRAESIVPRRAAAGFQPNDPELQIQLCLLYTSDAADDLLQV